MADPRSTTDVTTRRESDDDVSDSVDTNVRVAATELACGSREFK